MFCQQWTPVIFICFLNHLLSLVLANIGLRKREKFWQHLIFFFDGRERNLCKQRGGNDKNRAATQQYNISQNMKL